MLPKRGRNCKRCPIGVTTEPSPQQGNWIWIRWPMFKAHAAPKVSSMLSLHISGGFLFAAMDRVNRSTVSTVSSAVLAIGP